MSTSDNHGSTGASGATIATITNSGSTNTPGFTLTIAYDGSGTLTYKPGNNQRFASYQDKRFPAGTFSASQLSSQLQAIGDVSSIPSGHCMKSASFGTRTTITYEGKTSGDLSCPNASDTPAHLQLKRSVLQLANQAK
ncbi:hypothetical protein [Ktedonospora formicarum]|uniref:Uncharacterized protein n=1 Tax=Ktedonospora formicarum TaxID=2778364 RepID=A0A8J3HYL4_9CHLR|nr:hypothetical protein [Ktedonospora formicarum]GHO45546.1 hypothetical protein KSX_37090 [Ktedonospora formicarum]